jgi:hypothetical protein
MTYKGVVHGDRIDLDDGVSLPEGTRVTVQIAPDGATMRGTPEALLALVGTLTTEEGERIAEGARRCRQIDPALWKPGS